MSDGALERKSAPASKAGARAGSSETGVSADNSSEKRKRGRPRKAAPAEAEANTPPRKRGRPRKHPLPDPNAPKRKRGRPRKVAQSDAPALTQPAPTPQAAIAPQPAKVAYAAADNVAQVPKPTPGAQGDAANRSAERPQAKPEAKAEAKPEGASASPGLPTVDFNALAVNMARVMEEGGKALAAYIRPIENGQTNPDIAEHVEDAVKTFGHVAEYWLADPARAVEAQTKLTGDFITLWGNTLRRSPRERPAGCGARARRQALRRPGVEKQPALRLSPAGVCDHDALGQRNGREG